MANVPKFDIFLGPPGKDAVWLESIRGLSNAKDRMLQISAEKPGSYFVFFRTTGSIVAQAISKPVSDSKSEHSAA